MGVEFVPVEPHYVYRSEYGIYCRYRRIELRRGNRIEFRYLSDPCEAERSSREQFARRIERGDATFQQECDQNECETKLYSN